MRPARFIFFLCICLPGISLGQTTSTLALSLGTPTEERGYSQLSSTFVPVPLRAGEALLDSTLEPSGQFLPRYARENPTGYSFLCRQELAIERKSPIGVWVNLNETSPLQGKIMSTAHLRLRVFLE